MLGGDAGMDRRRFLKLGASACAVPLVSGRLSAAYGMSPYFRMSIATDIKNLEEACRRMQRAVAELK